MYRAHSYQVDIMCSLYLFIARTVQDSLISHRYIALPLFIINTSWGDFTFEVKHCHSLKCQYVAIWHLKITGSSSPYAGDIWCKIYETCYTKIAVDFLLDYTFPICVYIACKELRCRHWIVRFVCEILYSDSSLLNVQVFWDATLCFWVGGCQCFLKDCRAFVFGVMQSKMKCWHRLWKHCNLNISSFIAVCDHLLHNSINCLFYVHFVAAEEEEQGEEVEEATSDQEFNTG